jgi:4-amino-4-deoxy-L-arabinose transferase-like glycosyltransferase
VPSDRALLSPGQRTKRVAIYAGALLLLTFYFVQPSRIATNHTDGGLILTYIDDMAHGLRPHFDFIDAYGPLNWPIPVFSYWLAGNKEWGVRIWLVLLKLLIVVTAYVLVRRLAGTLYGILGALFMTLLFGQAWHSLQTAYAFNNVVPVVFAAWYLVLARPWKRQSANYIVAGILTGIAIWTKVNSGLFVLFGGLFYLFYWLPPPAGTQPTAWDLRWQSTFRVVRTIGLATYALVFYMYLRRSFDVWYFLYMYGPLSLGLYWTWRHERLEANTPIAVGYQLRAWGTFFGACLLCMFVVLMGVTRVTEVFNYLREQADIFLPLEYDLPFPPVGSPDEYIGFNENFWPQLPWLLPLVFLAWMELQRRGRGEAAFGSDWREQEGRAVGLYVMATLYLFVIYSRADETHIFQAMVGVPLAALVLLRQIEAFLLQARERVSFVFRSGLCATLALWGSTIVIKPGFRVFDLSTGERSHPVLQYLLYRELDNPYIRNFTADLTDHDWDITMDDAARYVDSLTDDGDTVLVMDANRLFHIVSNTRPVGGRYHFYFYMISTKLFRRPGYDLSVPPHVLQEILDNPPKVVVGAGERVPPIAAEFPEIRKLVGERYRITRRFRHVLIFERKDLAAPQAINAARQQ